MPTTAIIMSTMRTVIVMDDLLIRAVLGAGLLGAAAGPIGCFVLWRRMAYLGSSIAEMALLGVALGLTFRLSPLIGVAAVSLLAALLLARPWESASRGPRGDGFIPIDTRIGVVGHAGLALGFVLLANLETVRADLLGYLFGDVLALSYGDVAMIAGVAVAALLVLAFNWNTLLADTVSADIHAAESGPAKGPRARAILLVLIAGLIAFGLQIVGALLIVALLIIPPAAARGFARTPEAMAIIAALVGALSAPLGIAAAFAVDAPAGPSIVLAAAALFVIASSVARIVNR
jgi:zinc transport system permease protein